MEGKEPYCFGIWGNATGLFQMTFHTFGAKKSGSSEIKYDLFDPNNQVIKSGSNPLAGFMEEKLYKDGIYTICYTNVNGKERKLNFDIVATPQDNSVKGEVLEVGDLQRFESELQTIHESMERVSHLINANTERTNEQLNYKRKTDSRSTWFFWKSATVVVV
mmetsp:Transcript_29378/g.28977  ORF Transcript_29378/g.28977 Transcript_29378/m.28977 type:complete len:162 (+) Transcript_29378:96-581(+)